MPAKREPPGPSQRLDLPSSHLAHDAPAELETTRTSTRSPHPYHRRKSQPPAAPSGCQLQSHPASSSGEDPEARLSARYRDLSTSLSESGTEADDEGYSFVKTLPAPPVRQHKGLRDLRNSAHDGTSSPLLTPSKLNEEGRKLGNGYFMSRKRKSDASSPSEEEALLAREKFMRRRRAELLRRASEVALLAVIGALILHRVSAWQGLSVWSRVELSSLFGVFASLIILYPLRLLASLNRTSQAGTQQPMPRIRIPAAFDPAPLLYPGILPVLISLSLCPQMENILLPNIVLAISTLPPQLIPSFGHRSGYSVEHWFVSIIPLIVSEHTDIPSSTNASKPYLLKSSEGALHPEIIASLFPLHQALLPTIQYLTTTSLLPAELQLLSVSLINLLAFSKAPEMRILSTIIWLGALTLLISCGHVIRWGVALARIPKWRFRRAGQITRARQSFLQILRDNVWSTSKEGFIKKDGTSDSDANNDVFVPEHSKPRRDSLRLTKVNTSPARINGVNELENKFPKPSNGTPSGRHRRSTLSELPFSKGNPPSMGHRQKRSKISYARSFLALTASQAASRKWFYAAYVYFSMAFIILVPIRLFIMRYVLDGVEPFGWAIGYLLGNLRAVRFWVFSQGFTDWIALPPLQDADAMQSDEPGRAEYVRRVLSGPANARLIIIGYWLGILAFGMAVVLRLTSIVEVDTRRKVFHGMMVAMLLPTIYIDPAFVSLTLALVLSVFLLIDLIRASQLPPLSKPIAYFLTPYVDGRDLRGPVVVSHIFLLIGCAVPLWLSLSSVDRIGERPWDGWDVSTRDVSMTAGVVCVGMGDAAASLVGRRFGRRKWPWLGGKSLEGSLAFTIAVTAGLLFGKIWLELGQWGDVENDGGWVLLEVGDVVKAFICGGGASFMEAVLTGGNDNVVVPLVLWLLVRGMRL
ncbi:hypothetical protein K490DRAFT_33229 [Saccharata proteae CBS 121410]|uniref:dolichol kinase n=1 Tax=Saccharata proteae CBS 121410 TaxID=1314787 RepID=A0A9P4M119_9PEZI|nr:hypothetical protein K490DRAFT_33229 [Saccharata proteae CBS 121410]